MVPIDRLLGIAKRVDTGFDIIIAEVARPPRVTDDTNHLAWLERIDQVPLGLEGLHRYLLEEPNIADLACFTTVDRDACRQKLPGNLRGNCICRNRGIEQFKPMFRCRQRGCNDQRQQGEQASHSCHRDPWHGKSRLRSCRSKREGSNWQDNSPYLIGKAGGA